MKFGVENRNVNFASPLIERNLSTSARIIYQRILTTEAPAAHQSTRHTQSSAAERTCTASSVLVTVWRMFAGQSCPPSTQQKPYQPPCSLSQAVPPHPRPLLLPARSGSATNARRRGEKERGEGEVKKAAQHASRE